MAARMAGRPFGRAIAVVAIALLAISGAPAKAVTIQPVTSPGGITAWLVEDHANPIIALNFAFRGGAALDPAGKEGLAEIVSGLLDEGAGDLDSQAFRRRLDELALTLSFDSGMDTFRGRVKTLTRNRDEAFDLLRLAMTEPRFDEEPVRRVRDQILTILKRSASDPDRLASRNWWGSVFAGHPYGRPTRGTEESVNAITVADMRGFVARRLARDNLVIGVAGDITAAELGALLDATFGDLPAAAAPVDVAEVAPGAAGEVILVPQPNPQSTVVFGHGGVKRDDPDYYAAYVMNYVLGGGGFSSRLYAEVREKRGLAYSVYSYLSPLDHAGVVIGGVGTANERVGQSIDIIRSEWRRMAAEGPTEAELDAAKTFLTGSFPLRLSSTSAISGMLVGIQMEDLGIDYLDRRNDYIEAVGPDDTRRVARRLLDAEALTFVVVGQPEGITATRTIDAPS